MKKIIKILILLFVCGTVVQAASITREEALTLFIKAGLAYKDGHYQQASSFYEDILKAGWESGPVYYNLADSYFRQGALGKAILDYERARRLQPRDSDIEANYHYALSLIKNSPQLSTESPWQKFLARILQSFSISELIILLLVLGFILAVTHLWGVFFQWPKQRKQVSCAVLMLGLLLIFLGVMTKVNGQRNSAIVLKDSACRFEPREEATTYFESYEGNKVRIVKNWGEWVKIERPDGKIGWMRRENLEKI